MKIFLLSGKGSGSEGKMRKGGFALAHRSLSHFCAPNGKFIEPNDEYLETIKCSGFVETKSFRIINGSVELFFNLFFQRYIC